MISKLPAVKTLSERAFEELRSAILEGKIPPGTRLVERTLAEDMGISRTPVHDALTGLVKELLVKKLPNKGFVVSRIEKKEIIQYIL
ncbi:MAG: GntR family transcriptional regulator, partial [Aminobacteriaceae bacterium]